MDKEALQLQVIASVIVIIIIIITIIIIINIIIVINLKGSFTLKTFLHVEV